MTSDDEKEIVALMRAARAKSRGHADFFGWATDRDLEEWGVIAALAEALAAQGQLFFDDLARRGRGNDPPDCEAVDSEGRRIAIEVTELVDARAIHAYKRGLPYEWSDWPQQMFISSLAGLIAKKGERHAVLKGGPYDGGYVVVVFTDEPLLPIETVRTYLGNHAFVRPDGMTRAFLVLSYDPRMQSYPYVELNLDG